MMAGTRTLNADLHSHSTASDGVLSPAQLAARAHAQGVELYALTDHDELDGIAPAREMAHSLGMCFVSGVEVSVTWASETIHVLGLGVNECDHALTQGLASTRRGRDQRAREMASELARAGVPGAYEGARKYAGNPDLISRTHFARYIVELGVCADIPRVFDRFLVEGKPGYVPHRWAKLADALTWIRGAGGVAVLAHPGRYGLDEASLWELVSEFRDGGGEAIEVVCGSHTAAQADRFAGWARRFGFKASRGSDFHAPGEGRADLGTLPPLPSDLVPVWEAWA